MAQEALDTLARAIPTAARLLANPTLARRHTILRTCPRLDGTMSGFYDPPSSAHAALAITAVVEDICAALGVVQQTIRATPFGQDNPSLELGLVIQANGKCAATLARSGVPFIDAPAQSETILVRRLRAALDGCGRVRPCGAERRTWAQWNNPAFGMFAAATVADASLILCAFQQPERYAGLLAGTHEGLALNLVEVFPNLRPILAQMPQHLEQNAACAG